MGVFAGSLAGVSVVLALLGPAAGSPAGWQWPVPPPVTVVRAFAPPPQPWLPGHRGVDLAGRPGEIVRSAGAGAVRFAGRVAGVGVVSVEHPDGLVTTYQPVRATVRVGDPVAAGRPLGRLVISASHCAPRACLHWGLRRGTDYLDPLALLRGSRVRLLPLASGRARSWLLPAAGGTTAGWATAAIALAATVRRRRRRRDGAEAPLV